MRILCFMQVCELYVYVCWQALRRLMKFQVWKQSLESKSLKVLVNKKTDRTLSLQVGGPIRVVGKV